MAHPDTYKPYDTVARDEQEQPPQPQSQQLPDTVTSPQRQRAGSQPPMSNELQDNPYDSVSLQLAHMNTVILGSTFDYLLIITIKIRCQYHPSQIFAQVLNRNPTEFTDFDLCLYHTLKEFPKFDQYYTASEKVTNGLIVSINQSNLFSDTGYTQNG